jgi:hypothetical protein
MALYKSSAHVCHMQVHKRVCKYCAVEQYSIFKFTSILCIHQHTTWLVYASVYDTTECNQTYIDNYNLMACPVKFLGQTYIQWYSMPAEHGALFETDLHWSQTQHVRSRDWCTSNWNYWIASVASIKKVYTAYQALSPTLLMTPMNSMQCMTIQSSNKHWVIAQTTMST